MAITFTSENLLPELQRTLQIAINEEVNKAADEAAYRVRAAISQRLGSLALSLLSEYSVERRGSLLVVTVKMNPEADER